jgi:hypothetical protein
VISTGDDLRRVGPGIPAVIQILFRMAILDSAVS